MKIYYVRLSLSKKYLQAPNYHNSMTNVLLLPFKYMFFRSLLIYEYFAYMYVYGHVHTWYLQGSEDGIRSSGRESLS